MRRHFLILYMLASTLLLTGCRGDIFASRRDMERLRPVQSVGLDRQGEGVALSISTGVGLDGGPPLVMAAPGVTIEDAVRQLQDYSPEDELFYAHARYILLGESMAAGDALPEVLDWVERSPAMRMETPLLAARGSAEALVSAATGESADITERLASLEREEKSRGRRLPTLRQAAASLLERGYALVEAVAPAEDDGRIVTESEAEADALAPAGLALLRPGATAVFLTPEETLGTELLTGGVSGARVTVEGFSLEIISGAAHPEGIWSDAGTLTGIRIRGELRAGLLEGPPGETEAAGDALETAAAGWLRAAVSRAQALDCDFLGLKNAGTRSAVLRREAVDWDTLPVEIAVEARLDRGYDLMEGSY